jgi:hypothetical protein
MIFLKYLGITFLSLFPGNIIPRNKFNILETNTPLAMNSSQKRKDKDVQNHTLSHIYTKHLT